MVALHNAAFGLEDRRWEVARGCRLALASLVVRSEFDLRSRQPFRTARRVRDGAARGLTGRHPHVDPSAHAAGHLGLTVVAISRPRGVGRMDSRTPRARRCLSPATGHNFGVLADERSAQCSTSNCAAREFDSRCRCIDPGRERIKPAPLAQQHSERQTPSAARSDIEAPRHAMGVIVRRAES